MSEENQMTTRDALGTVTYNKSVFSAIARNVIEESDFIELAEGRSFRAESLVTIKDGKLSIRIPVRIAFSANVTDICAKVQKRIYESISYMTDYKPESVSVQVVGFIF